MQSVQMWVIAESKEGKAGARGFEGKAEGMGQWHGKVGRLTVHIHASYQKFADPQQHLNSHSTSTSGRVKLLRPKGSCFCKQCCSQHTCPNCMPTWSDCQMASSATVLDKV